MAETIRAGAYPAETAPVAVSTAALRRISWGAVLAGAVIVIAVQISLSLLGLGIGLSTVDPAAGDTPGATSLGLGAGIWWVVSNLIALVIGGYVAARLSGMPLRGDGIIHGRADLGRHLADHDLPADHGRRQHGRRRVQRRRQHALDPRPRCRGSGSAGARRGGRLAGADPAGGRATVASRAARCNSARSRPAPS